MKKFVIAVAMVLSSVALALAAAEALLRVFDYPKGLSECVTGHLQADAVLIYAMRPGFSSAEIHVNRLGLRGPNPEAWACARNRVMILGDSMVFGYRVTDADSFPARLQALFGTAPGDTAVINVGVTGYGSDQSYKLFITQLQETHGLLPERGRAGGGPACRPVRPAAHGVSVTPIPGRPSGWEKAHRR